jgi:hypothetical protein
VARCRPSLQRFSGGIRDLFDHSDAGCSQYNVSVRIDTMVSFITSHVSNVCLRGNPTGPHCDGVFRNGTEPPLN